MSQTVTGWLAGSTYTLTLSAATRVAGVEYEYANPTLDSPHTSAFAISVDDVVVAAREEVANGSYQTRSYSFNVPSGSHVLTLSALTGLQADTTTFLDDIKLSRVAGTAVTRTPWQMHVDPTPSGPLSTGGGGYPHGDVRYYVDAHVPAVTDAWPAAPDGDIIGFDGRKAGFGGDAASRLGSYACAYAVDYTYFQTFVTVPAGGTVQEFSVDFTGVDDGARISVYNSAHPTGVIVDGSYVYLGGSGTSNLASYMTEGVNRVVITQLDDCYSGNNLREARIVLNGTVVPSAPSDATPPGVTPAVAPATADGANGWYVGSPGVSFTVADSESPVLTTSGCDPTTVTSDTTGQAFTCTATSAGGTGSGTVTLKRDATAPVISGANVVNSTWRKTALTSSAFTSSDATSGLAAPADASFTLTASAESASASAPTTASRTVTDNAGNSSTRSLSALIDLTAPSVALVGAAPDGSPVWTSQPAPTCSGSDALSGLASCVVTGSTATAGSRTVTATATDRAGNTSAVSRTYTVRKLTSTGFYAPVDMGGVVNTVKGGSTVPLKFNVLVDGAQQTSTSLITGFTVTQIACSSSAPVDDIEMVTTGATVLRYDTMGGQFIQNWKTPTVAGTCYRTTADLADGTSITALFKTK